MRVSAESKQALILVLALAWAGAAAFGAQNDGRCGSLEKFNQTKRWEDLPGCVKYDSGAGEAEKILSRTKESFERFFIRWFNDREFGTASSGVTWEYNENIKNFVREGDEAAWSSSPKLIAARPAYEEMSRIVGQHLALKDSYPLIKDLGSSFTSTKYRTKHLLEAGGKDSELAAVYLKSLRENLAKVVAAGVPDATIITAFENKSYSLGDIRAEVEKIAGTQTASANKFKAAEEEKWRPFTTALKGDRLTHFNRYRDSYEFRGVGGRILRTPADFQNTPIMAALSVDDNGVLARWELTIWRFRGNSLVGKQTRTGWGRSAPSSAYR
jgi:hypothetical protein